MRDVNGIGFELVLGREDWTSWTGVQRSDSDGGRPIIYDRSRRSVGLRGKAEEIGVQATDRGKDAVLGPEDRTGAARDRYGNWYWIDADRRSRILVRNVGDGSIATFWSTSEATEPNEVGGSSRSGTASVATFAPRAVSSSTEPSDEGQLGGLTITRDHRLIVGTYPRKRESGEGDTEGAEPTSGSGIRPALLVFDLHGGGPPRSIPLSGVPGFDPIDASPRAEGGLFLLDRSGSSGNGPDRLWVFDRALQVVGPPRTGGSPPTFRPKTEGPGSGSETGTEDRTPARFAARDREPGPYALPPGPAGGGARSVVGLPDGTVLVAYVGIRTEDDVEEAVTTAVRYDPFSDDPAAEPLQERGRFEISDRLAEAGLEQVGTGREGWEMHDVAFVAQSPGPAESFRGSIYVVGIDAAQAYHFKLFGTEREIDAELVPDQIPLRRYGGTALVAAGEEVYYDFDQRWLPLTARPRRRFADEGRMISGPMDSEIPECQWHRLFLDGCIPSDTSVEVETRTADRPDRLADQPWQPEPDLYLRDGGSELPYHQPFTESERDRAGTGTWELLLQRAEGRYLQVRLTLSGNGRATPRLYALRIYRPRFSYLDQYFPDVYQQDEESAHFFERYLANVEGTFTEIEGRIAQVQSLFDTRTVPDEYLDWLGSWFDAEFDAALDDRRKRLFLDHAVELYNQRGTPRGLARMLALTLDRCADDSLFTPEGVATAIGRPADADEEASRRFGVRIVEQFATRDVPRAAVGDATVPEQPVQIEVDRPWTPEAGAEVLHRRFEQFLSRRYDSEDRRDDVWPETEFPPLLPSSQDAHSTPRRDDWRTFVRQVVEGPYAEIEADSVVESRAAAPDELTRRFRAFLDRRYGRIESLSGGWPERPSVLEEMLVPTQLPTGGALGDWMDFVGLVLPIRRAAHRFRVLVPVEPEESVEVQRDRLDIARRVARREKPVHTAVQVLPYWAAFRVGTGRTGLDTILGAGSRYSDLLVGRDSLGDHTVGAAHPGAVTDRRIAGRDATDDPRPL